MHLQQLHLIDNGCKCILFRKINSFNFFEITFIFHHLLLYCDTSNEIIQSVAYDDNYDDFQQYFHKISFHYLEAYLMTKLTLG